MMKKREENACSPGRVVLVKIILTGTPGQDDYFMIILIILTRWISSWPDGSCA